MERTDDAFPFNSYRECQNKLSRAHASLLMQVRSGHLPLNFYLHRIGKAETKNCQACQLEPGDETPAETIHHFLYDCAAYTDQRNSFIRSIGAPNIALKDVMLQTKRMKALAQYITRTKRSRTQSGHQGSSSTPQRPPPNAQLNAWPAPPPYVLSGKSSPLSGETGTLPLSESLYFIYSTSLLHFLSHTSREDDSHYSKTR